MMDALGDLIGLGISLVFLVVALSVLATVVGAALCVVYMCGMGVRGLVRRIAR